MENEKTITTKTQVRSYLKEVLNESLEDYLVAVKPNELPMSEFDLEADFHNFLKGYFAPEDAQDD